MRPSFESSIGAPIETPIGASIETFIGAPAGGPNESPGGAAALPPTALGENVFF